MPAATTILAVAGLAISAATTGYSIYSSEQAESEARHERHKAERAAAAKTAQEAAKAESEMMRKKKSAWLSTVGESGIAGIPKEKDTLG